MRPLVMFPPVAWALFFLAAPPATLTDGHIVTIMRGDCTIRIIPVNKWHTGVNPIISGNLDTPQSRADAQKVKAALEKALEQSADMRTKVDDACKKHEDAIDIWLYRGSTHVTHASATPGSDHLSIDIGDSEGLGGELSGDATAVGTVESAGLTRSLAHEFDHMRRAPGDRHSDPAGDAAGLETGPAVDDENAVSTQMDFPFHRRSFYGAAGDGFVVTSFLVDTDGDREGDATVTWIIKTESQVSGPKSSHITPDALDLVPTLWEPISGVDQDLDGIPDTLDNCIGLVNPQQGFDC